MMRTKRIQDFEDGGSIEPQARQRPVIEPVNDTFLPPPQRDVLNFGEELRRGIELESVIGAADRFANTPNFDDDPTFDPRNHRIIEENPDLAFQLMDAGSAEELEFRFDRIQDLRESRRELSREGASASVATIVGALANPSSAFPVLRAGSGALRAASETLLAGTAEEAFIGANTPTREFGAQVANVGLMTGIGGLAGALNRSLPAARNINEAPDVGEAAPTGRPVGAQAGAAPEGEVEVGSVRAADAQPESPATAQAQDEDVVSRFRRGDTSLSDNEVREAARQEADEAQRTVRERMRNGDRVDAERVRQAQDDNVPPNSVGAMRDPETGTPGREQQLRDTELVRTGTGIERLPSNPRNRLLNTTNLAEPRELAGELVPMSGLRQQRNLRGVASPSSVSTQFQTEFLPDIVQSVKAVENEFLKSRGVTPPDGAAARKARVAREEVSARLEAPDEAAPRRLSEFRERVAKAMRRGDEDELGNEFVSNAAQKVRPLFDRLGREALEEGLFDDALLPTINRLKREIAEQNEAIKQAETRAEVSEQTAELNRLRRELDAQERKLESIRTNGPTVNTADSFLPRLFRRDRIDARREEFDAIIRDHLRRSGSFSDDAELETAVQETVENIRGARNHLDLEEAEAGVPRSVRERVLDIPDREIEDFLENDIEAITRSHATSLGTDTLLKRRFGGVRLDSALERIDEEATQAKQGASNAKAAEIDAEAARAKEDVLELRDRLRGTAGITRDPQSTVSRASRIARLATTITMSGTFGLSNLADAGSIVLQNGLRRTMGGAYQNLFSESAQAFRRANTEELNKAGTALEIETGLMASQLADTGSPAGRLTRGEETLQRTARTAFALSGINFMNDLLKRWAGTATSMRMNDAIFRVRDGVATQDDLADLAASGIDTEMARRIGRQISEHGVDFGGQTGTVRLPNVDAWDDAAAARQYREALNQNVERTIVTPDEGDRATWTTTEMGQVVAQFQSFSQAAQTKILAAGLQRRDRALLEGVAALVAAGGVVDQIKRIQFDKERDRDIGTQLIDAIEQSGVGGLFTTGNTALERLTGNRIGLTPLAGNLGVADEPQPLPVGGRNVLSVAGGPAGSQLDALGELADTVAEEGLSQNALSQARRFVPLQAQPGVDPVADSVFGP